MNFFKIFEQSLTIKINLIYWHTINISGKKGPVDQLEDRYLGIFLQNGRGREFKSRPVHSHNLQ